MGYNSRFQSLIAEMKLDGRYRTFIEQRIAGEFPAALWLAPTAAHDA